VLVNVGRFNVCLAPCLPRTHSGLVHAALYRKLSGNTHWLGAVLQEWHLVCLLVATQ